MEFVADEEVSDEETRPEKRPRREHIKTRLNLKYDDGVTKMYAEQCKMIQRQMRYLLEGDDDKMNELIEEVRREFPPLWYHPTFRRRDDGSIVGFRHLEPSPKTSEYRIVEKGSYHSKWVFPEGVECDAIVYHYSPPGWIGNHIFRIIGTPQDVDAVVKTLHDNRPHWGHYLPRTYTFENGTIAVVHISKDCE
jgi:hypothetical protein